MRYEFRGPGSPASTPIGAVVKELDRIRQRDGGVRVQAVVDESRPDEAPLHNEFEWNDAEAAEHYREEQARRIIRSVVLVPEPEKHETMPIIRAFISVHDPEPGTQQARIYRPTLEVLRSPADVSAVKSRLLRELLALRQRYEDFLEADELLNGTIGELVEALR